LLFAIEFLIVDMRNLYSDCEIVPRTAAAVAVKASDRNQPLS